MSPQMTWEPPKEERPPDGVYKLLTTVLSAVCAILLGLCGWMAAEAYEQISTLRARVERLELQQAVTTSTHAELSKGLEKIERKLDLIHDQWLSSPTKGRKIEFSQ